jgi:tape measure domain-containing protein
MALRDLFIHMGVSVDQSQLIDAQRNVNGLVIRMAQLQRIAGFALAALGVGQLTQASDAYATMANRLKSVTNSAEEFATAQRGVERIADETLQPVEAVTEAFQRYSTATAGLNLTQEETLDFTKRLSQAISLGGATAAESSGALIQFGQGLANNFKSGGQEINSLIEQAPKLANMLAKAVGGPQATAGQLKAMAKQGKLTGAVIVKAVRGMGKELDEAFGKKSIKFEDIGTLLKNKVFKVMEQGSPVIEKLTKSLKGFVDGPVTDWINNGEAMNTLLAGATVVVIALATAFGSLALSLAAAAAPWVLLFYTVEDFVTFMRGGESYFGDFFNSFTEGGADNARKTFEGLWQIVKDFASFIADPSQSGWDKFTNTAATAMNKLVVLVEDAIQRIVARMEKAVTDSPILGPLMRGLQSITGEAGDATATKVQKAEKQRDDFAKEHPVMDSALDWLGLKNDNVIKARGGSGMDPTTGMAVDDNFYADPALASPRLPFSLPELPQPTYSDAAARRAVADRAPGAAPQVTNNITVQGNADGQTARQIGKEAGSGTASALGRDRSAIGASVGMSQ